MGLKTFFDSFKDNTSNNINYVPDVTTLPAEEWKKVSPEDKKILVDSDKTTMPKFVENLIERLNGPIKRKRELKKAVKEQIERDPKKVYGDPEKYRGVFSDKNGRDER